jgi:hypothetical protein
VSKAEELREGMIQQYALSPREIEPMRRRLEVLLAAARAEGAEEERERIRKTGARVDHTEIVGYPNILYLVPASVLAPKESEK